MKKFVKSKNNLVVIILSALGACASGVDPGTPEELVAERQAMHLEYLRTGNWGEALQFTTPGFQSKTTPEEYAGRYGGVWMWQSTRVGAVSCEGETEATRCKVDTYRMVVMPPHMTPGYRGMEPSEHYLSKTWIKVGGEWYAYEK